MKQIIKPQEITKIGVGSTFIQLFTILPDTEIISPTVASISTVVGIEVNPP